MLETLRGAIAYMREKQILHKLGVAISIAVIATACIILYHMLEGLDVDDLYEALRGTEARPSCSPDFASRPAISR